jgi:hypothetical protein
VVCYVVGRNIEEWRRLNSPVKLFAGIMTSFVVRFD